MSIIDNIRRIQASIPKAEVKDPVDLSKTGSSYKYGNSFSDVDLSEYEGYTGQVFLPEQGREAYLTEMRAQNQSATEQWAMGIGKFVGKTATNMVGGLGMLAGLPATIPMAVASGDFSKIYDNGFQRALDDANSWMDENLPNYVTKAEQEMNLGRQMLTSNFWANDFLGGMSFVIGAILTEGAAAASAARLIGTAGRLGKMLQASAKAEDVAQAWKQYGNIVRNQKALGILRQTVTGAGFEAGVEARHFKKDALDEMAKEHYETYGQEPTEQEMLQYEDEINKSANALFGANLALVSMSNAITLTKTFGRPLGKFIKSNPISQAIKKIANPLVKEGDELIVKQSGTLKRALKTTYKLLEKPFTEGIFEEGLQGVMSSAAMDYTMKKLDPENLDHSASLAESMINGFEETYGTKEGRKEILIGALMGFTGSYAPGQGWQGSGIKDAFDAWTGRDNDKFAKMANKYNNLKTMPILTNAFKANARQYGYQKEYDEALELGDMFAAKNKENAAVNAWMDSRYETGQLDVDVKNFISEIKEMSNEAFRENFGYDNNMSEEEISQRKEDTINAFQENVENYKKSREVAEKAVYNEEDTELIEGITHTLMGIKNLDKREEQMAKDIAEKTGIDGRKLKDIMRANNRIKFKKGWSKTFKRKHSAALGQITKLRNKLAKINSSLANMTPTEILENIDEVLAQEKKARTISGEKMSKANQNAIEQLQRVQDLKNEIAELEQQEFRDRLGNRKEASYSREDFESFQKSVREFREIEDKINNHYDTNPIDKIDVETQLNDLGKVAARRRQLIDEYNYFATKKGQEEYKSFIDTLKENIDKRVALDEKDLQLKKSKLSQAYGNYVNALMELESNPNSNSLKKKVRLLEEKLDIATEEAAAYFEFEDQQFMQEFLKANPESFENLSEYQSAVYRTIASTYGTIAQTVGMEEDVEPEDKPEDGEDGEDVENKDVKDGNDPNPEKKEVKGEDKKATKYFIIHGVNTLFDVYNKYFNDEQKLDHQVLMEEVEQLFAEYGKEWYKHFDYKIEVVDYTPDSPTSPATGNPEVFVKNGIEVDGVTKAVKVFGKSGNGKWVEMGALTDPRRFVDEKGNRIIPINEDGSIRYDDLSKFNPEFSDGLTVTDRGKDFIEKWMLLDNMFKEIKNGNLPNIKDYLKAEYFALDLFEKSKIGESFSPEVHGISSSDINDKGIILKVGDRYHIKTTNGWRELVGSEQVAAEQLYKEYTNIQGANPKSINDTVLLLNTPNGGKRYINVRMPLGTVSDMEMVNERLNELFDNIKELRGKNKEETRKMIADALGIELTNDNPDAPVHLFPSTFNIGLGGLRWEKPNIWVNQSKNGNIMIDLSIKIKDLGNITIRKTGSSFYLELSFTDIKRVNGQIVKGKPQNKSERLDKIVQKFNLKADEKFTIGHIANAIAGNYRGPGNKNNVYEALSSIEGVNPKYSEKNMSAEDPFATGNFDEAIAQAGLNGQVVLRPVKDATPDLDIPIQNKPDANQQPAQPVQNTQQQPAQSQPGSPTGFFAAVAAAQQQQQQPTPQQPVQQQEPPAKGSPLGFFGAVQQGLQNKQNQQQPTVEETNEGVVSELTPEELGDPFGNVDDIFDTLDNASQNPAETVDDDDIPFSIVDNLDELIESGEVIFVNEEGIRCAQDGGRTNINFGGKWKIVKDLKGYPTHKEGGVNVNISKKGVTISRKDSEIKAEHGLILKF